MTAPHGERANDTRLDSWKEIAAYMNRDRRTVQRWEANEGLPVHRHVHESQATVYAYTSELDAWLASRTSSVESAGNSPPAEPKTGGSRWAFAGIALFAILAISVFAGLYLRQDLGFQEHDWVLVGAFENESGDSTLDGVLRNALERELSHSRFVYVTPRERIEDTLRLMRKPRDARLDRALAQEVCVRDGGIRAFVTGKTEKLGSAYVFSVELVDPIRGRTVASKSEAASGTAGIEPAIRRLSDWIRESLGEAISQIAKSNSEFEKVTTPSLRAWQLFSAANNASRNQQWALSAELNRQALAEDTSFAAAHLWLAWALSNLKDEGWKVEARRAMELSNTVSERERLFIVASNHLLNGRTAQAIPVLEALVRMHPDFYWGYPNLANAYRTVGRLRDAAEMAARTADARPNDYLSNARAGRDLLPYDVARAGRYFQRARELQDPKSVNEVDRMILFSRFYELWAAGEVRKALDELRRLAGLPVPREVSANMAAAYLMLGRPLDAEVWLAKDDQTSLEHADWRLQIAVFLGQEREIRERLSTVLSISRGSPNSRIIFLCGIYDVPGCSDGVAAALKEFGPLPLIQGVMALRAGRNSEAIPFFQQAFERWLREDSFTMVDLAEGLVAAHERNGDIPSALGALARVSPTAKLSAVPRSGMRWIVNQSRMAALYRKLGRTQDAEKIEEQLRKVLAVAEPDFPLLRQLQGR